MSTETMGSSVYCSIFLNWVKDASLKAVLISEILTSVFEFMVISVSDPLGTGTLIPHPPITVLIQEIFLLMPLQHLLLLEQ